MTIQKRQSIIIIAIIAATISIAVAAYESQLNVDQTNSESTDNPNTTYSNYEESPQNTDYSEKESITRTEVSKLIKNYEKYGKTYFTVINAMNVSTTPDSTEYYPFAVENESFIILAHGANATKVGTVANAFYNADKPIKQIQSELEENGSTWITYKLENPANGIIQGKISYLVLQEDGVILGSGYYLD